MLFTIMRSFSLSVAMLSLAVFGIGWHLGSVQWADRYTLVAALGAIWGFVLLFENITIHDRLYHPRRQGWVWALIVLMLAGFFFFVLALMLVHPGENGQSMTELERKMHAVWMLFFGFLTIIIQAVYLAEQGFFTLPRTGTKLVFSDGDVVHPGERKVFWWRFYPTLPSA